MIYCNEHDAHAAEWIGNLSAAGVIDSCDVDSRDIQKVTPDDLRQYSQVHLFAGIGGWPLAFRLAGIPPTQSIWSGSCPCQPYSAAGKRKGNADDRNLWPEMFRLIRECRPDIIVGEQVKDAIRHRWLDGICSDVEGEGYAVGSIVLGAHSAGSPHIRQRLYWMAVSGQQSSRPTLSRISVEADPKSSEWRPETIGEPGRCSSISRLADSDCQRFEGRAESLRIEEQSREQSSRRADSGRRSGPDRLEHAESNGRHEGRTESIGWGAPGGCGEGPWSRFDLIDCLDGKTRRVESGSFPLAHGIPRNLGPLLPRMGELGLDPKSARRIGKEARRGRVGRLHGYGNGIIPELAAEFLLACRNIIGF